MTYEEQLVELANSDTASFSDRTAALGAMVERASASGREGGQPTTGRKHLITNIPEMRSQATTYIEPEPVRIQPAQQQQSGLGSFLSNYEKRLQDTPDFQGKQSIINELRDDAMQRMGNAQKATQTQIEERMNLPNIRRALDRAMYIDSRDRTLEGLDSPETAKLRAGVLKMEEEARKTTQDILKNNPDLQRFAKAVDSTITQHEKLAEKSLADAEKLAQKQANERETAAVGVAMLDPAARAAITRINPAMKDDVAYYNFIQKGGGKNKDWAPILLGEIKDTDYVQAALTTNNLPAKMLAISEESARSGRDPKAVDAEFQKLETLAKNPALALEALQKGGAFDGPEGSKRLKDIKAKITLGDATTRKEVTSSLIAMLPALSERNAITEIRNNPPKELMQIPEFAQAYQVTSDKKGAPANIQEAGQAWMREPNLSNEERLRRQDILVQAYAKEVERRGQSGIFYQMDRGKVADEARKMKSALTANIVRDTFLAKAGALFGETARGAGEINFINQAFQAQETGLRKQYGLLDEFVQGMMGGNK